MSHRSVRRAAPAVLALATVVLALVLGTPFGTDAPRAATDRAGCEPCHVELTAPDRWPSGEAFTVVVRSDADEVQLRVIRPLDETVLRADVVDGQVELTVEPRPADAGLLLLEARAGDASTRAELRLEAGPVVGPVLTIATPRTTVVGGPPFVVTALPLDANGNAAADGTTTTLMLTRPDGDVVLADGAVGSLASRFVVSPGDVAGSSEVRVDADAAVGRPTAVIAVAGPPEPFALQVDGRALVAGGLGSRRVRSTVLRDAAGNELADGVVGHVRIEGPDGVGVVPTEVLGGRIEVNVPAPPTPGPLTLVARVGGVTSESLVIEFAEPALAERRTP